MKQYTHLTLNEDIKTISGYYTPLKEVRLQYDGREVLYVVGQAVIESSCCGSANYGYALVPGYIINWQGEKNKRGLPVSEVELISDKAARTRISEIIEGTENITQIEFW